MADDGEVDIEGEFDFKHEVEDGFYDVNELPSKSANLLPEYTNPPWMLEQGWTLDMDEKSKATIEKMLLEEQQYLNGKTRSKQSNIVEKVNKVIKITETASPQKSQPTSSKIKTNRNKRAWTLEEKSLFMNGLSKHKEIFPHQSQAKNESPTDAISEVLASMETGLPTVQCVKSPNVSHRGISNGFKFPTKFQTVISTTKTVSNFTNSTVKASSSNENMTINILDNQTNPCAENSILDSMNANIMFKTEIPNNLLSSILIGNTISNSTTRSQLLIPSHINHDLLDDLNTYDLNSFDKETEPTSLAQKLDNADEDGDSDDEDVDIENYDEDNKILLNRSTSPTSVYEKLLQSAKVDLSEITDDNANNDNDVGKDEKIDEEEDENHLCIHKTDLRDRNIKSEEVSNCSSKNQRYYSSAREEVVESKIKIQKTLVNGVISSSGELVEFPIPTVNVELNFDEISEEEQTIHSEFFDGRQSKTPDRYLKIRNHIIESWLKCKPVYLNKTSVRKGLKNCGDVNCIGRIHSYLECIGVINFGCEQALYNNLSKTHLVTYKTVENPTVFTTDKADMYTSRCNQEKKPKIMNVCRNSYDPFKLVPCLSFTDEKKAPFKVELNNIALIVMDVHAHISKTEVIGMLGGIYDENNAKLEIVMAVPCRSMSTGMQCEMDPVSQTHASDEIYSKCLKVVGWYHSHPTFSPNPSIRDIETQIKFQEWFSKLGGGQFVGIIVSPYNRLNTGNESEVRCLTISQDICPQLNCNIPYQFDYQVIYSIWDDDLVNRFQVLAEQYSTYNNQVTLSGLYKQSTGISCLQKMLESIKQYISNTEKKEEILNMTFNIFHEKTM